MELIPVVPVNVGGSLRNLKFDFRAMKRLENATGKKWHATDLADLDDLRTSIWAGLLHESPDLSIAEVEDWLHPLIIAPLTRAVIEAWGISQAEEKAEETVEEAERPPMGPRPN